MYHCENFNEWIYHIGIPVKSLFVPIVSNKSFSSQVKKLKYDSLAERRHDIFDITPPVGTSDDNDGIMNNFASSKSCCMKYATEYEMSRI